jgi:uncharacterized membrane protein/rubredoxin
MKKMVRCKACGYIMEEGKLGDKCPACGVPRTSFEPYADSMSASRRNVLNIQLHPIAVHFPISFVSAVLVFSIAIAFFSGSAYTYLVSTTKVLLLFVPVLIIAAGVLGFIDGKIRFRKVGRSHILKTKIAYAVILFVISVALTVIVWIFGFDRVIYNSVAALLAAIALAVIVVLGLLGTSIKDAALPGK